MLTVRQTKINLTPRQLEVYKLTHPFFENLSFADAAKRLGISKPSVTQIVKAIKKKYPKAYKEKWRSKQNEKAIRNFSRGTKTRIKRAVRLGANELNIYKELRWANESFGKIVETF